MLIAAVEAYRISGWEMTEKCLKDLYRNYMAVKEAEKKDDAVSEFFFIENKVRFF